jgi:hypothetical protein
LNSVCFKFSNGVEAKAGKEIMEINLVQLLFELQPSPHRNQRQRPTSGSNSCPVNQGGFLVEQLYGN